jgi:hypothetical protein
MLKQLESALGQKPVYRHTCVEVSSSRSCGRSAAQRKVSLDCHRFSEVCLLLPVALPGRKSGARPQTQESGKTPAG